MRILEYNLKHMEEQRFQIDILTDRILYVTTDEKYALALFNVLASPATIVVDGRGESTFYVYGNDHGGIIRNYEYILKSK